jgi:hypothetical protein
MVGGLFGHSKGWTVGCWVEAADEVQRYLDNLYTAARVIEQVPAMGRGSTGMSALPQQRKLRLAHSSDPQKSPTAVKHTVPNLVGHPVAGPTYAATGSGLLAGTSHGPYCSNTARRYLRRTLTFARTG